MYKIKEVLLMVFEGLVFIAIMVVAYLFLAGLCVTIHDVAACSR